MDLLDSIRTIPDFPKKGILFYDITTLLKDPKYLAESIDQMHEQVKNLKIDAVAGAESRGFIFGVPLAIKLGVGFIPIRKKGKLPAEKIAESYALEYGEATMEMHKDAVSEGKNILLVDDLLATGGTALAAAHLIEKAGGKVSAMVFLMELGFLNGREKISDYKIRSLINVES